MMMPMPMPQTNVFGHQIKSKTLVRGKPKPPPEPPDYETIYGYMMAVGFLMQNVRLLAAIVGITSPAQFQGSWGVSLLANLLLITGIIGISFIKHQKHEGSDEKTPRNLLARIVCSDWCFWVLFISNIILFQVTRAIGGLY